jgi:hypothetical protein
MSGHWHNPEKSSPILRGSEALHDEERHRRGHCKRGGEPTYAYYAPYSTYRRAGIAVAIHSVVPLAAQAIIHQFNPLAPEPGVQAVTDVASTTTTLACVDIVREIGS